MSGSDRQRFVPQPVAGVPERVNHNFHRIFQELQFIGSGSFEFEELHAAPTKVYDGLTVFADGTDWNPGSGQGVYTYYNSAWNKLG